VPVLPLAGNSIMCQKEKVNTIQPFYEKLETLNKGHISVELHTEHTKWISEDQKNGMLFC
jgi:hypothetical protein